ncbi:conserved hypothetical protein [Microsporum canis CBS 113480]|uniref:Protein kinase domain-containing protein n=1 Tax=Arthroderma otae (strain ATCC MYA-4605 / CBS 113480) TaxID=554155 RepID=C5FWY1_ARTOC|nr:conserved hypothetical protein [Microsporum canis CBS 113480]EEQ34821.1 conserved hypothetical protein [Microsporum canis CBS 113480]
MSRSLRVLFQGMKLIGKRGETYTLHHPLIQRRGKRCHIWSASKDSDALDQYVIKQPDDEDGLGWPNFTKELEMQKKFQKSAYIRRMVDLIPAPTDLQASCMMVLEPFEKSLWDARLRRPLILEEIRSVMRSIAIGLGTIHQMNLVHTDLTGDQFNLPLRYLHLLQALANFDKPGMFDSLKVEGTLADKENATRALMVQEFDLQSVDYYTSDPVSRKLLPIKDETRTELDHWVVKLLDYGTPKKDIETVYLALDTIPERRPTAMNLLEYGYI